MLHHIHAHIETCIYTRAHTHTCAHTHMHTYTHTHTHNQTDSKGSQTCTDSLLLNWWITVRRKDKELVLSLT